MGNRLQKNPYPPDFQGSPGDPGSPYIPGYYTTETVTVQGGNTPPPGWHWVVLPPNGAGDSSHLQLVPNNQTSGVGVPLPPANSTVQVQVWHPAVPAVPPIPPSPPVYPVNRWDAGAQSIGLLAEDGTFACHIGTGVGGVAVGFTSSVSLDPRNIEFGVYCHNGVAQGFVNNGTGPTLYGAAAPYSINDVWKLQRRLGVVTLLKNNTAIYTGPSVVLGPKTIQASLFSGYDAVYDASIVDDSHGSLVGEFQKLRGVTGTAAKNRGVQGNFRLLTGNISARARGSLSGSLRYLQGSLGEAQSSVVGTFRNLAGSLGSGGMLPQPPTSVLGYNVPLQGVVHGLTGEVGSVNGSFRKMDALIGKARQGKLVGTFPYLFGNSQSYPPGTVYIDSYAVATTDMPTSLLLVASIDSFGVASDVWLVTASVDPEATQIDSSATGQWDWVVNSVATVYIDSTAYAHDLMGTLVGAGTPSNPLPLANQTVAWVLNLDNQANSRYDNYPYTSFGTRQGTLYGTKADGVYLLSGADDAGTPILASFASGVHNFADPKDAQKAGALKRIPAVYLGVASDQAMYLKIVSNGAEYLYVSRTSNANLMQQRVDTGRGLRSSYYSFEVYNQQGSDFDLESIEFIPVKLGRRIG